MSNSVAADKTFNFAVQIVKLYKYLCDEKREYVLSKQLLRSGTSVGANVREALQGLSKRDFLLKIGIALKEAYESLYWIELLYATSYIDQQQQISLFESIDEIIRILVSIVKTTKKNLEIEKNK